MRQIKFRGKRIDNGEWVYGCLIIENPPIRCFAGESDNDKDKYLIGKSGFADWNMPRPFTAAEVDPATVGQLRHINVEGVEYYDGDIYYHAGHGEEIVSDLCELQLSLIAGLSEDIGTIIGNIHDKK